MTRNESGSLKTKRPLIRLVDFSLYSMLLESNQNFPNFSGMVIFPQVPLFLQTAPDEAGLNKIKEEPTGCQSRGS